jgi:C-terminal processing protease CtpA/Prc
MRLRISVHSLVFLWSCWMGLMHPSAQAWAQTQMESSSRSERLAALGRFWASLQYFHPFLAYQGIDWDSALALAIPAVSEATGREAYAAGIQILLDALHDPLTRLRPAPPASTIKTDPDPKASWTRDSVLVVSLRNYGDFDDYFGSRARLKSVADSIRRARRVVFDLRATAPTEDPTALNSLFADGNIAGLFTAAPLRTPDQRGRLYSGFPPEDGTTSGGYYSGFHTLDGDLITPGDSLAGDRSAVFLADGRSQLPGAAIALRAAGKAWIAMVGPTADIAPVKSYAWHLPDSLEVTIRLTELIVNGQAGAALADTVILPDHQPGRDAGMETALALSRRPPPRRTSSPAVWMPPAATAKPNYGAAAYPSLPQRMIAAFRIWAVGQYFFPYRDLANERWDQVLVEFLPRFEAARDSLEYALAAAQMATRFHDSHVRVSSPALKAHVGVASPPIFVRMIEGLPVVSHFTDDSAAKRSGIRVGDIILTIDGERADTRLRRSERYISASTPQALRRTAARRMLTGPEGSSVELKVRRSGQLEKTITLPRRESYWGGLPAWTGRRGPVFRILAGNIGYADLGRLAPGQVDSMFDRLRHTRAIIFDMRGYPQGTAWSIAPRLTNVDSPAAARFSRPLASSPDTTEQARYSFVQQLPRTSKWRYTGRTVMLIDERTQSQAEHTGLFFEAANGTKFVGTPTAGANGDVTTLLLPGGLSLSFSGHEVRHADGRQLQRIGLVPDLTVRPTIAGVREGRDEVLERALSWLRSTARP